MSAHRYIKQQIQYLQSLDVISWAETKQSHDNDSVVLILFLLLCDRLLSAESFKYTRTDLCRFSFPSNYKLTRF